MPVGTLGSLLACPRCWRREQDAAQPIRPTPPQPDQPPHVGQLQFAVGTQEAVVANFLKAGRREPDTSAKSFAITHRLDVNDPVELQHNRWQLGVQSCLAEMLYKELLIEHRGW